MKAEEITDSLNGFYSTMLDLISRHRQKRDALNQVQGFTEAVETERARMNQKYAALLSNDEYRDLGHEISAAQHACNLLADSEIARAAATGRVEHDTLITAARGLADAVGKLETKGGK
jgi:hypothetical protein